MFKLVVLFALVAVVVARPGYLHGLEHSVAAIALPTSAGHQSSVPAHQAIFSHDAYGENAHNIYEDATHDIDSITVDVVDQHEARSMHDIHSNEYTPVYHTIPEHDSYHFASPVIKTVYAVDAHNIHHLARPVAHTIDAHNVHHLASPLAHAIDAHNAHHLASPAVHAIDAHNAHHFANPAAHAIDAHNVHHLASPAVHSVDAHDLLNIQHLDTPIVHAVGAHNVHHLANPVYKTVNSIDAHNLHHLTVDSHDFASPIVEAREINHPQVHLVQQIATPVVQAVHASPVVKTTEEKSVVSSHELHQVHETPAVHAVHHDGPTIHSVAVPASAVSHTSRTDVHKTSSSVVSHSVPTIHAW